MQNENTPGYAAFGLGCMSCWEVFVYIGVWCLCPGCVTSAEVRVEVEGWRGFLELGIGAFRGDILGGCF